MATYAKDIKFNAGDLELKNATVSILGKTSSGKFHIEYDKGLGWIFKTVEGDFDLETL